MDTSFLRPDALPPVTEHMAEDFQTASPFPHAVIDDFLPPSFAELVSERFPKPESEVWLDWRKRSGHQYGKQGPGGASRFDHLDPVFETALLQLNNFRMLRFLEALTGIEKLLPDPHFRGGGIHSIVPSGFLDVHTDFNKYTQMDLYRRLNVLIYLNKDWDESEGGALELWDKAPPEGRCQKAIAPEFNRAVIFCTNKISFHGHPTPWNGRNGRSRRSIALYFYSAQPGLDERYSDTTEFQGVAFRELTS